MLYKLRKKWWGFRNRCQRFLRGYAWSDVWDLDFWFIDTVEPMLRHLQKNGIGIPNGYSEEGWKEHLDQMADHLHLMGEWNVVSEVFDGDYSDVEKVHSIMNEHKEKFFEMFSKDFYNLWD